MKTLSVLSAIAVAALWATSHFYDEAANYKTKSGALFSATASQGYLCLEWNIRSYVPPKFANVPPGGSYSFKSNRPRVDEIYFIYTCRSPAVDIEPVLDRVFGSPTITSWSKLGITFTSSRMSGILKTTQATVPFWILQTLTTIPLLIILIRIYIRGKRNPFACPTCNYDLRASPGRCPECGHECNSPSQRNPLCVLEP